jgi:hypothetical protein
MYLKRLKSINEKPLSKGFIYKNEKINATAHNWRVVNICDIPSNERDPSPHARDDPCHPSHRGSGTGL